MHNRLVQPISAGLAWLILVTLSFGVLLNYKAEPGAVGSTPDAWPSQASIAPVDGHFNLVVAIHPHCPCSRATLHELARVLARCPDNVETRVLIWKPETASANWGKTDLWSDAQRLPRSTIVIDEEGRDAERFGAKTSGQVLLWGSSGVLLFQGGITASRGHEGDNPASEALRARICGEQTQFCSAPVFGCRLSTPLGRDS